jgi:hypothetical protein
MDRDIIPDTVKVVEAELREEVEAQRLQDEARFSPLAGCCQYGCDGSGWRDLSEFETSPSSVEADARPSSPPDIFFGGRWLTPCECNAISAYTCVGAKCYPPMYKPPATETYYAILNLAHPLGPTILMGNDKGAYRASEIVEAWCDAVTAMHEHRNDSLCIVKVQVVTRVADEAEHFEPCPECGMYVPKNQPCCWCEA